MVTTQLLGFRQVGVLIDGIEFIPQDIFLAHLPAVMPPSTVAVYVRTDLEG